MRLKDFLPAINVSRNEKPFRTFERFFIYISGKDVNHANGKKEFLVSFGL